MKPNAPSPAAMELRQRAEQQLARQPEAGPVTHPPRTMAPSR